ncbi:MAG: DUF4271 domain-containing protein [Bacteroidota bacterium]|nr:DUF4271 domain-containing protein [Bacteroidota bacterium]
MKIESIYPQFRDTTVSTLLRRDAQPVYQFSTSKTDSVNITGQDTALEKVTPVKTTLQQKSQKKTEKTDLAYKKILDFKKSLSGKKLIRENIAVEQDTTRTQEIEQTFSFDSIVETDTRQAQEVNETLTTESKSDWQNPIAFNKTWQSHDWMIGILLFVLISIGWIRMRYRKLLINNRKAALSIRDSKRLFGEQNFLSQRIYLMLNFVFFINLALFISQILEYYQVGIPRFSGFYIFSILLLVLIILYLLKILIYKFIAFLFQIQHVADETIYIWFVINRLTGLVLLPFIITIPFIADNYVIWLIYGGLTAFILLYLLQVLRSLQLFIMNISSVLYSILYLCALEIAPVIIIYKFCFSFF